MNQTHSKIQKLATALLLAAPAVVQACEGCKSTAQENGTPNAIGEAFGISIYFLLGCPLLLLSGMAWLAVRTVRRLEQERALVAISGR